jgi:hypothetical protein
MYVTLSAPNTESLTSKSESSDKNMVMGLAGPGTKNDCAGEGQQQSTRPTNTKNHFGYLCRGP